jgi:ribosome maturation factor RimP
MTEEYGLKMYIGLNVLVVQKKPDNKDWFFNGIVKEITDTHLFLEDTKTDSIIAISLDSIKSIQPKGERDND